MPMLELKDDKSVAPVAYDGDVAAAGSVCESRVLQIGGALTVGGALEAVTLSAGGAVTVAGGLIGKQKGRYTVGGDLRCRFVTGGSIMCRNDVYVQVEVINSRLTCTGRLDVSGGTIYGGDIAANGGVACRTLGHDGGIRTVVEAGDGRALRLLSEAITTQIEENRKRVLTVRAAVEPLMQQMKRLSPQQREKATELLYEAGELDAATATMAQGLEQRQRLSRERARAEVVVGDIVHANVVVRFGGIEAVITTPIKGPLRLTTRKNNLTTEIIAVDGCDGSVCVLPMRSAEPAAVAA